MQQMLKDKSKSKKKSINIEKKWGNIDRKLKTISYSPITRKTKLNCKQKHIYNNLHNKTTPNAVKFPTNVIKFKNKQASTITQPFETVSSNNSIQKVNFFRAVEKVFNSLNPDKSGVISHLNISSIPIKSNIFYFLGSVFKKIRDKKLNLTFQHFLMECVKIQRNSSSQDISQFIKCSQNSKIKWKKRQCILKPQKNIKKLNTQSQINEIAETISYSQNKQTIENDFQRKTVAFRCQIPNKQSPLEQNSNYLNGIRPYLQCPRNEQYKQKIQYFRKFSQSPCFEKFGKMRETRNHQIDTSRLEVLQFKLDDYIKKNQQRMKRNRELLLHL